MFNYFILFILGICFGSFSTVLISRWKSGKGGIMMGRSECPHCSHTLTATELIPILSWILQRGKCKNCHTPIPSYYPLSEVCMGIVFIWAGWIAMNFGYGLQDLMFWIFIFWTFTTAVYCIYDIRYMEIPDQILVPGILITVGLLGIGYLGSDFYIFYDISSYDTFHTFITDHISAAIFIYTFFFLQILIPGVIHFIREKKSREILSLTLSYFTFPLVILWDFATCKKGDTEGEAIPAWIGGGDLRIAIFIGLTLGGIHSLSALFFAYISGSIVGISLLLYGMLSRQKFSHEMPFGPFLALGWFLSLTFYDEIISYLDIINI